MSDKIFEIGSPPPKCWLHFEFDFEDTQKYIGGCVINDSIELDRLVLKYLDGINEESIILKK